VNIAIRVSFDDFQDVVVPPAPYSAVHTAHYCGARSCIRTGSPDGVTVRTIPPTRTRNGKQERERQLVHTARRHHDHADTIPSAPDDYDQARPSDKLSPSVGVPLPGQSPLRGGRAEDVWTDKRRDDCRASTERGDRPQPTRDGRGARRLVAQENRPRELPPLPTDGAGPTN
jgi:hypothetical protein